MGGIVELYRQLQGDRRLQRDWEQNQSRRDRALESVLIARCSREVATAVLLSIKLRYEPAAAEPGFLRPQCPEGLLAFGRTQGSGGSQLVSLIGKDGVPEEARAAAVHALQYYRNRSAPNPLVRLPWSDGGLQRLTEARWENIILPALRPSSADRKAHGIRAIAGLILTPPQGADDDHLRRLLRDIPGLGPERADYVGVFLFSRGWPIVDEYLWRLLHRHGLLSEQQSGAGSYDRRRRHFDGLWRALIAGEPSVNPGEMAATLHLWSCEAERFHYEYALSSQAEQLN